MRTAPVQSDQGLRRPQIESLDTTECFKGEQILGHVQNYVNPHILRMLESICFAWRGSYRTQWRLENIPFQLVD